MTDEEELPPYDDLSLPAYNGRRSSILLRLARRSLIVEGFTYKYGHLHVSLDRPMLAGRFAAYGFNALVDGYVQIPKKCNHVVDLQVRIEAIITTAVTSGPLSYPISKKKATVLCKSTLYHASPGPFGSISGIHPFSIPFPTYFPGKHSLLPPSFAVYHLAASYQISYFLKVDLTRRGVRRHETLNIPILYLPRKTPIERSIEVPKYSALEVEYATEEELVTTVELTSKDPERSMPTTNLILPATKRFVSGEIIPLTLTLRSFESPVLALLWSQRDKLSIKLIKRSRIWKASSNHGISVRDVLISEAELRNVDDSVEGLRRLCWITRAGSRVQEELSWQIDGVADVRYLIQVCVRAPDGIGPDREIVRHEESIDIATDLCTADSAGENLPALGLITAGADRPVCRA